MAGGGTGRLREATSRDGVVRHCRTCTALAPAHHSAVVCHSWHRLGRQPAGASLRHPSRLPDCPTARRQRSGRSKSPSMPQRGYAARDRPRPLWRRAGAGQDDAAPQVSTGESAGRIAAIDGSLSRASLLDRVSSADDVGQRQPPLSERVKAGAVEPRGPPGPRLQPATRHDRPLPKAAAAGRRAASPAYPAPPPPPTCCRRLAPLLYNSGTSSSRFASARLPQRSVMWSPRRALRCGRLSRSRMAPTATGAGALKRRLWVVGVVGAVRLPATCACLQGLMQR